MGGSAPDPSHDVSTLAAVRGEVCNTTSKDTLACMSYGIAATPHMLVNRAFPDRHRAPEEETLLSFAIAHGDVDLGVCL